MTEKIGTVYFMGGAVFVEGNVNIPPIYSSTNEYAEWNVFCDSKAALIVF